MKTNIELIKLTEKTTLHDVILLHSTTGSLRPNIEVISKYINVKTRRIINIEILNIKERLSSVSKLNKYNLQDLTKNKISDHESMDLSDLLDYDNDEKFENTSNVKREDILFILYNLESLVLVDPSNKLLSDLLLSVYHTAGFKLWVIANSDNIHLLTEQLDSFPELMSHIVSLDSINSELFEPVQPSIDQFNNLKKSYRKWLWNVLAVKNVTLWTGFDTEMLHILYQEGFLKMKIKEVDSTTDDFEAYIELASGKMKTKILSISNKPWNKFLRNRPLQIGMTFCVAIFLIFGYFYQKATIEAKNEHYTSIENLNSVNQYRVHTDPSKVLESIVNGKIEELNSNNKEWWHSSQLKDSVEMESKYLLPVYNSFPSALFLEDYKTPYNSIDEFEIKNEYIFLLENDTIYYRGVDSDDSSFRTNPLMSGVNSFKVFGNGKMLIHRDTSIWMFDFKANKSDSIWGNSDVVYDMSMSGDGDQIFILADTNLYYKRNAHDFIKKGGFTLLKDTSNSPFKLFHLWDGFVGIKNNTAYKIWRIKDDGKFTVHPKGKSDKSLGLFGFEYKKGNDENFVKGECQIFVSSDLKYVTAINHRKKLNNKYETILKISQTPGASIKCYYDDKKFTRVCNPSPHAKYLPTTTRSRIQQVDYSNNRIFMGFDNTDIISHRWSLSDSIKSNESYKYYKGIKKYDRIAYKGHSSAIEDIILFENEQIVASLSKDKELILWHYSGIMLKSFRLDPTKKIALKSFSNENSSKLFVLEAGKIYTIEIPKLTVKVDSIAPDTLVVKPSGRDKKDVVIRDVDSTFTLLHADHEKLVEKDNCYFNKINKEIFITVKLVHNKSYRIDYSSWSSGHKSELVNFEADSITSNSKGVIVETVLNIGGDLSDISKQDNAFYIRKGDNLFVRKRSGVDTININHFHRQNINFTTDHRKYDIIKLSDEEYLVAISDGIKIIAYKCSVGNSNFRTEILLLDKEFNVGIDEIFVFRDKEKVKLKVFFENNFSYEMRLRHSENKVEEELLNQYQ